MSKHSLFFQGNDVETGLIGDRLGFEATHLQFPVDTDVPSTLRTWWRQRLAWAGGEFRLFIVNFRYVIGHPFMWIYGAVITIAMFILRWWAFANPGLVLLEIAVLYYFATIWIHWRSRNRWLLLLPIYQLFSSLVLTPIGIVWYFVMAIPERNFGVIRVKK